MTNHRVSINLNRPHVSIVAFELKVNQLLKNKKYTRVFHTSLSALWWRHSDASHSHVSFANESALRADSIPHSEREEPTPVGWADSSAAPCRAGRDFILMGTPCVQFHFSLWIVTFQHFFTTFMKHFPVIDHYPYSNMNIPSLARSLSSAPSAWKMHSRQQHVLFICL